MATLDEYANFGNFREAMAEYARANGVTAWNSWLHDAAIIARSFEDAPQRGRNLEWSRVRAETYAEALGPDWRRQGGAGVAAASTLGGGPGGAAGPSPGGAGSVLPDGGGGGAAAGDSAGGAGPAGGELPAGGLEQEGHDDDNAHCDSDDATSDSDDKTSISHDDE